MKLQNSKSSLNKVLINTKIFQTIQIPEHIKPMNKIQKYLTKLGSSVKLLDQNKSNNKTNQRNSFHQSSSVILKNIKGEKERLIHDYQTIRSNPYEKKNEPKSTNRRYFKSRYLTDKLSFLKEKNKILLNKKFKTSIKKLDKSNDNNGQTSYENKSNSNENEIFVTHFNIPKVKENIEVPGTLKTELNENNRNNINNNINIKYKYSLPLINSKSFQGNNFNIIESPKSRNRIKTNIMKTNNSFNIKLLKNKFKTEDNNTNNQSIDKEKENDISSLNKKLISLFGYDFKHSTPTSQEIPNFLKRLKNIKRNINKKNYEYELDKWIMRSKMKYVNWKFGINDLEKYFLNVDEFGIKEKNELELRKSFYKKLNVLIDDLKEEKEMRRIKEREKVYGINVEKEEKKVIKNNEYWNNDKAMDIMKEQNLFLKMTKERKIKERRNREIIDDILIRSKNIAYNIHNS